MPWLKTEFGWPERTARDLMAVCQAIKSGTFHDLQIDVAALYLIPASKTPEPVRSPVYAPVVERPAVVDWRRDLVATG